MLNRAQTVEDGRWRALDGCALLEARTSAAAIYNRVLEVELTRRLGSADGSARMGCANWTGWMTS